MRRPPSLLSRTGYLAGVVSVIGRHRCEEVLGGHGLRLAHYEVLVALADFGPSSQQEISASLVHDKSHLVRRVDDLERAGFLTRVREVDDRRRNRIGLTDQGRAVVAELQTAEEESERDYLATLSVRERQTLRGLLRRVVDANDPAD